MVDVVVAGHVCIDLFPTGTDGAGLEPGTVYPVGPMHVRAGGCVSNTARALSHLGASVSLSADAGSDELGRLLLDDLEADGLDTSGVLQRENVQTSYSIVVELTGRDRLFWHHRGANDTFDGARIDAQGARILHLGYPSLLPLLARDHGRCTAAVFDQARRAGATTSLDLAAAEHSTTADWQRFLESVLPYTDVLTASTVDLASARLTSSSDLDSETANIAASTYLDLGAGVVMIKRGARGLIVRGAGAARLRAGGAALAPLADTWAAGRIDQDAFGVSVAGTTGAGDAATAGLLIGLLAGRSPDRAAALAAAAAAVAIEGTAPAQSVDDLESRIESGWPAGGPA